MWDWTDSTSFNLYAWLDDTERNNEYCGVLLHSTSKCSGALADGDTGVQEGEEQNTVAFVYLPALTV